MHDEPFQHSSSSQFPLCFQYLCHQESLFNLSIRHSFQLNPLSIQENNYGTLSSLRVNFPDMNCREAAIVKLVFAMLSFLLSCYL